jgi:hypothetical protein
VRHSRQSHEARFFFVPMDIKSPRLKPIELKNARSSSACDRQCSGRINGARCRIGLAPCFPATSEAEKISLNQINKKTGHRVRYLKVDAETGEEVPNEDIIKRYKVDTDTNLEGSKDELGNIALESTRTIEIDEFVPSKRDRRPLHCRPKAL